MQSIRKKAIGLMSVALVAAGLASPAHASHLGCGDVVTENTVLDSDIGPCASDGLVIGADNVTLDLNGHRIFGTANPGDGAGVLVSLHTGVIVKNGTVSDFDGGVVIKGGSGNTVTGIIARDNIGLSQGHAPAPNTPYGDGIAILSSTDNRIVGNSAIHNGPYSGIGLFQRVDSDHPRDVTGPTSGNVIRDNIVVDNNICRRTGPCDNDGIRLEPDVFENVVEGNHVFGSALDGIAVFTFAHGNQVKNNVVENNGFHPLTHRKGDGIRIFGSSNLVHSNVSRGNAAIGIAIGPRNSDNTVVKNVVQNNGFFQPTRKGDGIRLVGTPSFAPTGTAVLHNEVTGNAGNGIAVDNRSTSNTIVRNVSLNNNGSAGPYFDLHDYNPECDANVWRNNRYGTANPSCAGR